MVRVHAYATLENEHRSTEVDYSENVSLSFYTWYSRLPGGRRACDMVCLCLWCIEVLNNGMHHTTKKHRCLATNNIRRENVPKQQRVIQSRAMQVFE